MNKDAAIAVSGILTFGKEAKLLFGKLSTEAQDAAFRDAAQAAADVIGSDVQGLVVHNDEASIHAHVVFSGVDADGMPLSDRIRKSHLKRLQDEVFRTMSAHCPGVERGREIRTRLAAGAARAETIHKSVQTMHVTLPADVEAARANTAAEIGGMADVAAGKELAHKVRMDGMGREIQAGKDQVKRLEARAGELRGEVRDQEAARDEARAETKAELARGDQATGFADSEEERAAKATRLVAESQGRIAALTAAENAKTDAIAVKEGRLDELDAAIAEAVEQLQPVAAAVAEKRQELVQVATDIAVLSQPAGPMAWLAGGPSFADRAESAVAIRTDATARAEARERAADEREAAARKDQEETRLRNERLDRREAGIDQAINAGVEARYTETHADQVQAGREIERERREIAESWRDLQNMCLGILKAAGWPVAEAMQPVVAAAKVALTAVKKVAGLLSNPDAMRDLDRPRPIGGHDQTCGGSAEMKGILG